MSENLAKLAQKIDFSKVPAEDKKEVEKQVRGIKRENGLDVEKGSNEEPETAEQASYQSSLWPWDSVRNKLRYGFITHSMISVF